MDIKEKIQAAVNAAFGDFKLVSVKMTKGESGEPASVFEMNMVANNKDSVISKIEVALDDGLYYDIVAYGRNNDENTEVEMSTSLTSITENDHKNIDSQIDAIVALIKADSRLIETVDEYQCPVYRWVP